MDDNWVLRMPWAGKTEVQKPETLVAREWLVTNGLGGYASGTVGGASTRRYHGLLIAALPAPLGRQMMLNHLSELLRLPDGTTVLFGGEERAGSEGSGLVLHGTDHLTEFRLESGLPVWHYEVGDIAFEKRILLPHQQNTVHVNYCLVKGGVVRLKLRPSVHFRSHDAPVSAGHPYPYRLSALENRYELVCGDSSLPRLRLFLHGAEGAFTLDGKTLKNILYRVEGSRGYESQGDLWSPGYFRADLSRDNDVTLTASTESWETMLALTPAEALAAEYERHRRRLAVLPPAAPSPGSAPRRPLRGPGRQLVLAADQFLITPAGRVEDAARARAAGDEVRTVIAGYHWFTDWGRDTMISLEGLTLTDGRHAEAGYILRTFAHAIKDGLIPNLFPEGEKEGLYHTADATMWFFHALGRYLDATEDFHTLRLLLPKLHHIIDHHLRGTRFDIKVDPRDGLLGQGVEGYQLTWMDAKVGDWVVTPRRGKPVEINALWYNALRLMEGWVRQEGTKGLGSKGGRVFSAVELAEHAVRARESFNKRFWYAEGNYLYDVIDGPHGDDASCRPNQLFAISLDHPVLERSWWEPVFEVVSSKLLTPVGLRSLAPGSPDYKPCYDGDLRARDAAYHQGTVWAWLIGAYIDVYLKLHPDDAHGARRFLDGLVQHLGDACIGSISEIFDAEPPYTPRGCVAQAWSVAEALRCWVKTSQESGSRSQGSAERSGVPAASQAAASDS